MNDPHDQTIALLVIERGAAWPTWGNEIRECGQHLVVEAQLPHESLTEFRSRILHRLAREKEAGAELVAVGYVCAIELGAQSRFPDNARAHDASANDSLVQDSSADDLPLTGFSGAGAKSSQHESSCEPDLAQDLGGENAGWVTVQRLDFCRLLLDQLEGPPHSERVGQGDAEPASQGQLFIGSGGWRGHPREAAGRAQLMLLWSELSGLVPGRVVSLRFDDAPGASGSFPASGGTEPPRAQGGRGSMGRPGIAGHSGQSGAPGLAARKAGPPGASHVSGEGSSVRGAGHRSWTGPRSVGDVRHAEEGPQSDRPSAVGAEN